MKSEKRFKDNWENPKILRKKKQQKLLLVFKPFSKVDFFIHIIPYRYGTFKKNVLNSHDF